MDRRSILPFHAKEFLNYRDAVCEPSTVGVYITALRNFYGLLKQQGKDGEKFFDEITRNFFEQWFHHMYKIGHKPITRRLNLKSIRFYLNWAHERGYLKQNPEEFIQPKDFPKEPKYLPRPLELQHDKKLIEYLKTSSLLSEKGLLLARYTGVRVGELLNFSCDCLRFDDDETCSIYVPPGKLHTDRLVPLTREGVELVKEIQKIRLKYNEEKLNKLMVGHKKNGSLSYSGMRCAMKRACRKAGIPHYTIHQLRHTFATSLLNAGVSIVTLQKLLGHKKIEMTLRYAEVSQVKIKEEFYLFAETSVKQYEIPHAFLKTITDPLRSFVDLIFLIEKKRQESDCPKKDRKRINVLKKLRRLKLEIEHCL